MHAGFLSDTIRDVLAIAGVVGTAATVIGLVVAVWQIRQAKTATQAATEATLRTLNEARTAYNRHSGAAAKRILPAANEFVRDQKWQLAALRMLDLADLLADLADKRVDWENYGTRLRQMAVEVERVHRGELRFARSLRKKWDELQFELANHFGRAFSPFAFEETRNDPD